MDNRELLKLMLNEEFKKDLKEITKLFSDGCEAIAKKHKVEFGIVLKYTLEILNTGLAITMLETIREEKHEK